MYKQYKIESIDRLRKQETVIKFLDKFHYLKGLPRGTKKCFKLIIKVDKKDYLCGVAVYGYPTGRGVASKYGGNTLELKRFALDPYCEKNTGSWFLAKCHKLLKKDRKKYTDVISYADPTQGHEGTLYKASNFEYLGKQKAATQVVMWDGQKVYTRNLGSARYKFMYLDGDKPKSVSLPRKHIYKYTLLNRGNNENKL